MRYKQGICVVFLTFAVAVSAIHAADTDLEGFRTELTTYVEALEGLPQPLLAEVFDGQPSFSEVKQQIAGMPDAELEKLHRGLAELPYWRQLPQMLRRSALPAGSPSPRQLSELLQRTSGLHRLREDALGVLDGLRRLTANAPDSAGYAARIDALETEIRGLSADQLISLRRAMAEQAPQWRKTLRDAAAGKVPGPSKGGCGTSFPASILCEIQNIINEIAKIPGYFVAFAGEVLDEIQAIFTTVVDAFPTDPAEILAVMGLDDPNWFFEVLDSVPILNPPCPSGDLPGLGTVGTIEAEYRCKRGLEWIANTVYKNAPNDIWGWVPFKIPAMIIYYPINYLCLCMESEARIAFDDAQLAHRELVSQMLDVTVGSRSSQSSVNDARAATTDLDNDVAVIEAKLDLIEGKADTLLIGSGAQADLISGIRGLALRMRIEAALFNEGSYRISLLQLPESVGGYLELTRAVVADTIVIAAAAGHDTYDAERELERGDFDYTDGYYKEAYEHYRDAYKLAGRVR